MKTSITNVGDPYIMRPKSGPYAGRYFLYASSSPIGFKVWSSHDLVEWRDEGLCYDGRESAWAKDCFWAPGCAELNGRYYLFFSANWIHNPNGDEETFRLGMAVSASPLGPFKDVSDRPLFDPGYPVIDADVFFDADGRKYITYSRCCYKHKVGPYEESHIYGAVLNESMDGIEGEGRILLQPCQKWENGSTHTGRRWNEGSFMLKHGGTYYLMFSANYYMERDYAIGYATASSPLGPYTKYKGNPILKADFPRTSGPGHNSCFTASDGKSMMIAYHCHTDPLKGGTDRQIHIDRLGFRSDGTLFIDSSTS